jgi:hypothetical protein
MTLFLKKLLTKKTLNSVAVKVVKPPFILAVALSGGGSKVDSSLLQLIMAKVRAKRPIILFIFDLVFYKRKSFFLLIRF